jgi:hypothetical protein
MKHFPIRLAMAAASVMIITGGSSLAAQMRPANRLINISASVAIHPPGRTVPNMFMGYSIEWGLIGRMIRHHDGRFKAMVRSIKQLEQFTGPMLLRIGGNSEDEAAYDLPADGHLPPFVHINIIRRTLVRMKELAKATGCQYVIGLNLGVNKPALAVRLVKAAERYVGRHHIAAFEIGNEADFLGRFGRWWKHNNYHMYLRRWTRYYHAIGPYLGKIKIEGPAFGGGGWLKDLPSYLRDEHSRLTIVSLHRYPLGAPIKNPHSPQFASIANLLKPGTADQFAVEMRRVIRVAAPYRLPVRFGEMNSAWGGGKEGVSNTFASTLWVATTLLDIARVGGAGVNLHMSQGIDQFSGWYGPLRFGSDGHLHRMPEYFGMVAAADVLQKNGRPVKIRLHTRLNVSGFAFVDPHHTLRVAIINRTSSVNFQVHLGLPEGLKLVRAYQVTAPSLRATSGVSVTGFRQSGPAIGRMFHTRLQQVHNPADGRAPLCPAGSIVIETFQG